MKSEAMSQSTEIPAQKIFHDTRRIAYLKQMGKSSSMQWTRALDIYKRLQATIIVNKYIQCIR